MASFPQRTFLGLMLALGLYGSEVFSAVASSSNASPQSEKKTIRSGEESVKVISKIVGEIGKNQFVSSREVTLMEAVYLALQGAPAAFVDEDTKVKEGASTSTSSNENSVRLKLIKLGDEGFNLAVINSLDTWAVELEAIEIGTNKPEKETVEKAMQKTIQKFASNSDWNTLEFTNNEIRTAIERQLRVMALERLKTDAAAVVPSDSEALQYFKKNRLKFGNLAFENFKENIKVALARAQMQKRLLEWRQVLRRKYRARNLLGA